MATLRSLKEALLRVASFTGSARSSRNPLSDEQYKAGFDNFLRQPAWPTYRDFIIPELSYLLAPLHNSESRISVLEIGPGPKSILGHLPVTLREKIKTYTAFEPNDLFADQLRESFKDTGETASQHPFPSLESDAVIHHAPFSLSDNGGSNPANIIGDRKYDIVLLCHSMYGMKCRDKFIRRALDMIVEGGLVAVFHHHGALYIDGLVCHHTASFPTGMIAVEDKDEALDNFASFLAGFSLQNLGADDTTRSCWQNTCRDMGLREYASSNHILFSAPATMMVFNQHATRLSELQATVECSQGGSGIHEIQDCVKWALKHGVGLTVVAGGHSAHCLQPNVVAVDMCEFSYVDVLEHGDGKDNSSSPLVVAGTGCKANNMVRETMAKGLTVPLGSRPSVGAGLWLLGGIGHLTRQYGLTCDSIVGAVLVSVATTEVFYVGYVPESHRPIGAVLPKNEADILWAIKGAGTNFGIVVSVTLKAYPASTYRVRNWIVPLAGDLDAKRKLAEFDSIIARTCDRNSSADAYLYHEAGRLNLGITTFDLMGSLNTSATTMNEYVGDIWGSKQETKTVNAKEVFDTEMYMSEMHGGHGGGKTSSFKRCVFLKNIVGVKLASRLVTALQTRPSPFCYLHLLHGGGTVGDVAVDATAFGCRDWNFACVVTGVWPRDEDGQVTAVSCVQWVYDVVNDLLPLSEGVYGADLGPDPRDAVLAAKSFGSNLTRLGRLKRDMDPAKVLAYACPLPKAPYPQLIILVTGESCTGKDYCAEAWVSVFDGYAKSIASSGHGLQSRAVSISDATKREYAEHFGIDLTSLLDNRAYKEEHRSELTAFFNDQIRQRPRLPEEHFAQVVRDAAANDVDVLFVTGMRDDAPVAAFSHLFPESKLVEVCIEADELQRKARGAGDGPAVTASCHRPSLVFNNSKTGDETVKEFARVHFLPMIHGDLQRLAEMARPVPNFPQAGVNFRHVLGIAQEPGGTKLCTSLLRTQFAGNWADIDAIVSCGTGGLVHAAALASYVEIPLVPIRQAGKLPPPTISVERAASYVSSLYANNAGLKKRIEMERGAVTNGMSVVVVDDVLSTGETLCAMLQLLRKAGVEHIGVLVVAEFPLHRGRALLRQRGFGLVNVQSLLVFGGV